MKSIKRRKITSKKISNPAQKKAMSRKRSKSSRTTKKVTKETYVSGCQDVEEETMSTRSKPSKKTWKSSVKSGQSKTKSSTQKSPKCVRVKNLTKRGSKIDEFDMYDETKGDKVRKMQKIQKKQKIRKFVLGAIVIGSLIILTVLTAIILIIVLRMKLQNMTEVCQAVDKCAYFKKKYVENCSREICHKVMLVPWYPQPPAVPNHYGLRFFAIHETEQHKYWASPSVDVPDGSLCRMNKSHYGVCSNQKCIQTAGVDDEYVKSIQPIDGGWSSFSSKAECLAAAHPQENPLTQDIWRRYPELSIDCSGCDSAASNHSNYEFRSCTNPLPSFGGKLCWETSEGAVEWYEWPMHFKKCPGCRPFENKNLTCNKESEHLICLTDPKKVDELPSKSNDQLCCNPDLTLPTGKLHPGMGACILRFCLPLHINKITTM